MWSRWDDMGISSILQVAWLREAFVKPPWTTKLPMSTADRFRRRRTKAERDERENRGKVLPYANDSKAGQLAAMDSASSTVIGRSEKELGAVLCKESMASLASASSDGVPEPGGGPDSIMMARESKFDDLVEIALDWEMGLWVSKVEHIWGILLDAQEGVLWREISRR
ncbi:hypothetical protein JAAARDRAFT_47971 [Jaapia argillacea MUCL 33604]|uniref:Uncharacterized protein n=1 Tax=Jaapia argillacea MUCL 33604 TaxID=933084 RepID=A0A067PP95_9AGAM|nr:hypothetical protein JAAARDRAFT_47971 [Jaapia argillacea MUCL 33604]